MNKTNMQRFANTTRAERNPVDYDLNS